MTDISLDADKAGSNTPSTKYPHRFDVKKSYGHLRLEKYIQAMVNEHGSNNAVARILVVNSSHISNVLAGKDSPLLRKILRIPKHKRRPRLNIEIDPVRFDAQRAEHGMSRAEYMVYLMSLDKLPY